MSLLRSFVSANRRLCRAFDARFPGLTDGNSYRKILMRRIHQDLKEEDFRVLEIGGIDRPLLEKNTGFVYDGMDIDEKENCYRVYDDFIVQSIELPIKGAYEMIISITLLEHVQDNQASARNIFDGLAPAGKTHHYIPSAYHPYSLCLRMVGPRLQKLLIPILRPDAVGETGYPAFFNRCSTTRMRGTFEKVGFEKIDVVPFYNANDYFAFLFPAWIVVVLVEYVCRKLDLELFASGFVISAEKPGQAWK